MVGNGHLELALLLPLADWLCDLGQVTYPLWALQNLARRPPWFLVVLKGDTQQICEELMTRAIGIQV